MAQKVKKGDMVVLTAGNDKGKTGEVLRVYPDNDKVLVQGVNRVYRHMKPSRQHPHGGRIQKEMPIHMLEEGQTYLFFSVWPVLTARLKPSFCHIKAK